MPKEYQYEPLSSVEPHCDGANALKQGQKWRHLWRVINLIMTGFFLLATFVQVSEGLFIPAPIQLLWEAISHSAITAQRLFIRKINDPDPYIWIPVYLSAAILTLSIVIKPEVTDNVYWKYASVIHMSICISGSMLLVTMIIQILDGKLENPWRHEEGRELGGVLLIVVWLAICRFSSFGSSAPRKGSANALLLMTGMLGLLPLAAWLLCFIGGLHTQIAYCNGMFPGLLGSD